MPETKAFFIVIVICSLGFKNLNAQSAADTSVYMDLGSDLFFYDEDQDVFLPLVKGQVFHGTTLYMQISKADHSGTVVKVHSNQHVSVVIDTKMIGRVTAKGLMWDVDSLINSFNKNELLVSFYHKRLDPSNLRVTLLTTGSKVGEKPIEDKVALVSQRSSTTYSDFIIVALILIGVFMAVLSNYYPRVMVDFLRIQRALALRELDENLLKSRPFNRVNILFYAFISLIAALCLICVFELSRGADTLFFGKNFWALMWLWAKVSAVVMGWLLLKYLWVRNFASLFNIRGFVASHYFNYVRFGLYIFLLLLLALVGSVFVIDVMDSGYYQTLLILLLVALCISSLIIFLKLMNSASYKFLHLFSYLCGTEVIPLGILLFLGINQPF